MGQWCKLMMGEGDFKIIFLLLGLCPEWCTKPKSNRSLERKFYYSCDTISLVFLSVSLINPLGMVLPVFRGLSALPKEANVMELYLVKIKKVLKILYCLALWPKNVIQVMLSQLIIVHVFIMVTQQNEWSTTTGLHFVVCFHLFIMSYPFFFIAHDQILITANWPIIHVNWFNVIYFNWKLWLTMEITDVCPLILFMGRLCWNTAERVWLYSATMALDSCKFQMISHAHKQLSVITHSGWCLHTNDHGRFW